MDDNFGEWVGYVDITNGLTFMGYNCVLFVFEMFFSFFILGSTVQGRRHR